MLRDFAAATQVTTGGGHARIDLVGAQVPVCE